MAQTLKAFQLPSFWPSHIPKQNFQLHCAAAAAQKNLTKRSLPKRATTKIRRRRKRKKKNIKYPIRFLNIAKHAPSMPFSKLGKYNKLVSQTFFFYYFYFLSFLLLFHSRSSEVIIFAGIAHKLQNEMEYELLAVSAGPKQVWYGQVESNKSIAIAMATGLWCSCIAIIVLLKTGQWDHLRRFECAMPFCFLCIFDECGV